MTWNLASSQSTIPPSTQIFSLLTDIETLRTSIFQGFPKRQKGHHANAMVAATSLHFFRFRVECQSLEPGS